jgi:arylsulfatase A
LFVCFHEPHEPVASPPDLVALYPNAKKPGQAEYFANVTNVDRAVGRLLAGLEELKLADRTVVVFTSDNGPETLNRYRGAERSHGSPGPLRGMKLHVYEGGIRVPGILRWPGQTRPGQVVAEPIGSVDLLPTLCKAAGVPLPADRHFDGADFLPALAGKSIPRKAPLFWHYFRATGLAKVALRDGDWKILAHWDGPQLAPGTSVHPGDQEIIKSAKLTKFELYNLRNDVAESTDLAEKEPDRLTRLANRLREIYQSVRDEGPVWELPK